MKNKRQKITTSYKPFVIPVPLKKRVLDITISIIVIAMMPASLLWGIPWSWNHVIVYAFGVRSITILGSIQLFLLAMICGAAAASGWYWLRRYLSWLEGH